MTKPDPKDALILSLCEKLYICSRLLTRAAERLSWDTIEVQSLVVQLKNNIEEESRKCQSLAECAQWNTPLPRIGPLPADEQQST